jgi:hypothetical protein
MNAKVNMNTTFRPRGLRRLACIGLLATGAILSACSDSEFATVSAAGAGGAGGGGADATTTATTTSATAGAATASSSSGAGGGEPLTYESGLELRDYATNAPLAGYLVSSHDASGMPFATAYTGADGVAMLEVPDKGAVSVYTIIPYWISATTFMEPPAGEIIHLLASTTTPPPPPQDQPTTYKVYGQSLPAQRDRVEIRSNCDQYNEGGSKTSWTLDNAQCTDLPTAEFVVVAYQGNTPLAWGKGSAPVSAGAAYDIVVNVVDTSFDSLALSASDIPPGWRTTLGITGPNPADAFSDQLDPAPATYQLTAQVASLGKPRTITWSGGDNHQWFGARGTFQDLPPTLTVSPQQLAGFGAISVSFADATRPRVSWSRTPGPQGTFAYATFDWWDQAGVWHTWTVDFPDDGRQELLLPAPPPEAALFAPSALSVYDYVLLEARARADQPTYAEAIVAPADFATATDVFVTWSGRFVDDP